RRGRSGRAHRQGVRASLVPPRGTGAVALTTPQEPYSMLLNRRRDRKPRSSSLRWPSHPAGRIRPRLNELEDRCLLAVAAAADGFSTTVNTALIAPAATVRVVQTGDGEVALPAM